MGGGDTLRRLIVEFSANQFEKAEGESAIPGAGLLGKVKSLEMVHILKMVPGEFAAVVRVELKDPSVKVEDLLAIQGFLVPQDVDTELLDKESETMLTYFIRIKSRMRSGAKQLGLMESLPYFSTPFEFKDGKLRVTFLGNTSQIKRYLEILSKQGRPRYRVASLTDARFSPNSPLSRLTDKQRRVLVTAYRYGYYDVPRRTTSEELAGKLNLVKSTFSAHVRKAERRLLAGMLSEL